MMVVVVMSVVTHGTAAAVAAAAAADVATAGVAARVAGPAGSRRDGGEISVVELEVDGARGAVATMWGGGKTIVLSS